MTACQRGARPTGLRVLIDTDLHVVVTNVAGVQGHCESGFGRVADVFASQLSSGRDVGGSVGVYLDGKPVVTIWGGSADPDHSVP